MLLDHIPLICPLDGMPLVRQGRTLTCSNNHSYDIARQGYVNLLPVQFKASRDPGDSKEMIAARRRVLDHGLFDPLIDRLCELLIDHVNVNRHTLLVDAGCGEGSYTARFSRALRSRHENARVLGIDISKPAVQAAAARCREVAWVVASNHRLPLEPESIDMITSLFGFEAWTHWSEQQRSGQCVLVVDAARHHLAELRELIYAERRMHAAPEHEEALTAGYRCTLEMPFRFAMLASEPQLIGDLLLMTPHGHRAGRRGREAIEGLSALSLTGDVRLRLYRRE
ncbi:MAG: rRNA (guanine-N1)-methyltransferase [Gammaproteobacteria bacterium]|nr:MAG: rRNA (guanine-N1)-methyltransferase [Gammaproteobacteria bacterium]